MGPVIYHPIPLIEMEAWGRISGNQPTPWEMQTLRRMDIACVNAKNSKDDKGGSQYQSIGDYCQGKEVDGCRAIFGEQLEKICSTCPN